MIRELLEKNGLLCKDKLDIIYYGNDNEFEVFAIIDRTKKELPSYLGIKTERITDNQAIEQACRQYVKENGIELEWLLKLSKHIIIHNDIYIAWKHHFDKPQLGTLGVLEIKDNKIFLNNVTVYANKKDNNYKEMAKLIAWLFANDIEIKEDNNGM